MSTNPLDQASTSETSVRRPARPGLILALVSGAQFMFILDLAIVVLAVPSIQDDLRLDPSQPQWVVVTYGLTLGGFLLLGGRVADLFGRRQVLVGGLALFTLASLTAGLSEDFISLVASRAAQGIGAAFAAPAALSILTSTFDEGPDRNRALGIFGAVGASAASIGLVLGGALTTGPGWEWVFLMNVPIGAVLIGFSLIHIPGAEPPDREPADVPGAVSVTAGLMAIVYAIGQSVEDGWTSPTTLGFAGLGTALLVLFVARERRTRSPILPLTILRQRTLTTASVVAALVFGSFLGFNLQITLFMQQVLGYSAIQTGVAWLATSVSAVVIGIGVAARVVNRFGAAHTLMAGQTIAAIGLLWLSRTPAEAAYPADLLPGLVLIGIAIGLSGMAVQVAAFIGTDETARGLAGGLIESCREIGGALGTAIIATVVLAHMSDTGAASGLSSDVDPLAFTEGMRQGAIVAAAFSLVAALTAAVTLRRAEQRASAADDDRLVRPNRDRDDAGGRSHR